MPDISMCSGGKCPLKDRCYRFRAVPSEFQSMIEPPYVKSKKSCKMYMPIPKGYAIQELPKVRKKK